MNRWFDRAEEELERDLDEGRMTQAEFRVAMRDLRRELEDSANEAAERAYNREFE